MDYDLEAFGEGLYVVGCAAAVNYGMPIPATHTIGSDRYPMTVISVSGDKGTVLYARMDRVRGPELFEADTRQVAGRIQDDPTLRKYTLRKDGRYREASHGYGTLTIGRRELYYDPSF